MSNYPGDRDDLDSVVQYDHCPNPRTRRFASTRWLLEHVSPWTGLPCVREEVTGSPCDGKGHVSVASAFSNHTEEAQGNG